MTLGLESLDFGLSMCHRTFGTCERADILLLDAFLC